MIQHSKKILRAKELRGNMPKAEVKLWYAINSNQLGVKFRRQRPIGPYYVDFICLEKKLIIELDGDQHALDKNVEYDNLRTDYLEKQEYKVVRIPNRYIYNSLDDVITHLQKIVNGEISANDYFRSKYNFDTTKFAPPKIS